MAMKLIWWSGIPLLEYRCTGPLTGVEVLEANREAIADPRFPTVRWQLCDMESVDRFEISPAQVRTVVDLDLRAAELAPGMEKLALACDADLVFGYARMYETFLGDRVPGWQIGTFRRRTEALQWIGVPDQDPRDDD